MGKNEQPREEDEAPKKDVIDDDGGDEAEEEEEEEGNIDDSFLCCVCLDLLYKPVVLMCGHISCFWCVHRAMNSVGESHCPICRFPYYHFPSICQLFHFLLLKMYPVTYKRREKQVLEEEKKRGCFSPQFSPQFNDNIFSSHTCKESNSLVSAFPSSTCSQNVSHKDICSNGNMKHSVSGQKNLDVLPEEKATNSGETYAGLEATRMLAVEGNILPKNNLKGGAWELVSISDMLCVACRQLLFRPTVLNCGHVYCESCITIPVDEALRCQLCQSPHPKGLPKVCLELDNFLKKIFPREYALRTEAVQHQSVQRQQERPSVCARQGEGVQSSSSTKSYYMSLFRDHGNVHFGAGCDYCGMYPIIGQRYRCKDCVEEIGFDLCGECYNTSSKLPGRFNQQHTAEHKLELVQYNLMDTLLFGMASERSEDGSTFIVLSDDGSEDPEDGHAAATMSADAPEDPEQVPRFS